MKKIYSIALIFLTLTAFAEDSTNSTPVTTVSTKATLVFNDKVTTHDPYNADDGKAWTDDCKYYATNAGNCKAAGPVPTNYTYIGYNYQAMCAKNEVMVGFIWAGWGNRYALRPQCRTITIADLPT